MNIPNLKRVKIASEQELKNWLSKRTAQDESILLVTHTKATPQKYVSHDQVHELLATHGWIAERKYTLNPTLIGHVISQHCD